MIHAALHHHQTLYGAASAAARAGDQQCVLISQRPVMDRVISAQSVKECLEVLGRFLPVNSTDEDDAVRLFQLLIDAGIVVLDDACTIVPACTPAIAARSAVLDVHRIQMDLLRLNAPVCQTAHKHIFSRCRQAVCVWTGPKNYNFLHF